MRRRLCTLAVSLGLVSALGATAFASGALATPYCTSPGPTSCVWRDPGYTGDTSPTLNMYEDGNFSAYQPGPSTIYLIGWVNRGGTWYNGSSVQYVAGQTAAMLTDVYSTRSVYAEMNNNIGATNVTLYYPYE